ncbi:hypothetical protein CY34DRAFT_214467 [Suillus luteus UH-Slu-Lm8-n1]|uniref:Uncharacterized protein n=1 Tax=Suillus luteus UH-Slu-Lm8-n1 TaxID=930992 RepID=A0A0D0BDB1_9AGAM|nr:hypothetical protein CY34DRAFT_214467 [Suillus luteus UH-Slu-Lm8-n1]
MVTLTMRIDTIHALTVHLPNHYLPRDPISSEQQMEGGAPNTKCNLIQHWPVDSASGWQSQESINSPDETADLEPDDLMNSFVKAEDLELVGKLLRKLIDQWFP